MWIIFNSQGKAVASSSFLPDQADLALRGERAIFHPAELPLEEVILKGDTVLRKTKILLTAAVTANTAVVSVSCDDPAISAIPLYIGETRVSKAPGSFQISGEPGVKLLIGFDRALFRGDFLEVVF